MATKTKDGKSLGTRSNGAQDMIVSLKEPKFVTQRMSQSVRKTALIKPLPSDGYATRKVRTLHSQWTPVLSKSANNVIATERYDLIGHWFSLWTDAQRKRFIDCLLKWCTRSQLYYLQSWFNLHIPIKHADFTAWLPRFISLYIFSYLDPKSLSQASMVCWHWRFLTEQDELWMPKSVRLGWLLPYVPHDKEYGSWKNHYIKCLQSLNVERYEQQDTYGLLGDGERKTKKEKKDKTIAITPELPPWKDNDPIATDLQRGFEAMSHKQNPNDPKARGPAYYMKESNLGFRHQRAWTEPNRKFEFGLGSTRRKEKHRGQTDWNDPGKKPNMTLTASLDTELHDPHVKVTSPNRKPVIRRQDLSGGGSHYKRLVKSYTPQNSIASQQNRVLLLSTSLPSVQMLLASVRHDVHAILYEYDSATLEGIEEKLLEVLEDRQVMSVGIFTSGIAEIEFTPYTPTNINTLDHPETKRFWETLCSHIMPQDSEGRVDVFPPLAATDSGSSMLWQLGRLTGMKFTTPITTTASSGYAHILGEWHGDTKRGFTPIPDYFQLDRLEAWLAMADRVHDAIVRAEEFLKPYFTQTQYQILADVMGELIFDGLPIVHSKYEQVTPALMQAMSTLESQPDLEEDPLTYLGSTLLESSKTQFYTGLQSLDSGKGKSSTMKTASDIEGGISEEIEDELEQNDNAMTKLSGSLLKSAATASPIKKLALKVDYKLGGSGPDRRKTVAQQLVLSEEAYYKQLRVIRDVYYKPLLHALNSNNAIVSQHNLKMIFTDINNLVPVSKLLLEELRNRVDTWGQQTCIGDCFVKLQGRMKAFTNFHNNYPTALTILDKCREQHPAFRAFLKTYDRSPSSHMKTLTELFLAPTERIRNYSRLLIALQHWTPEEHADREDLATTLEVFKQLGKFGDECKHRLQHEAELLALERRIRNCPSLLEANRYLIREQHLAQWELINNNYVGPAGTYDHTDDLAVFLFNDAICVTLLSKRHIPYQLRWEEKLTYLFSVALNKLVVNDMPDTKFLQNAFTLKTPKREWVCSTENYKDKVGFIALLEDAIQAENDGERKIVIYSISSMHNG